MAVSLVVAIVFFIITLVALAVTILLRRNYKRRMKIYNDQRNIKSEESESTSNTRRGRTSDSPSSYGNHVIAYDPTQPSIWASRIAIMVSIATAVITIITFAASCFTTVPTKEYGVLTAFGQPVGTVTNGIHLKHPWENMTTIDAAIQTDSYVKVVKKGEYPCISVRIAHQATACVDASVRWRIKDGAADALFQNYRAFNNIRDSLVTRDLQATLNDNFKDYDALAVDESGNSTAPSMSDLSDNATSQLRKEIGDQIEVENVIIVIPHFDDNTQAKVNALQAQVAQTRIAAQAIITAQKQSLANQALSASVSSDPNVLVSKCLDIVESGKSALPAGFTCWPSSQSAIVVPSK